MFQPSKVMAEFPPSTVQSILGLDGAASHLVNGSNKKVILISNIICYTYMYIYICGMKEGL